MAYHGPLTAREVELVRYASQGLTIKDASERLGVTRETAKTYWRFIRTKLLARTAAQAVARAYEKGLLP